jgi:hypothetical protein
MKTFDRWVRSIGLSTTLALAATATVALAGCAEEVGADAGRGDGGRRDTGVVTGDVPNAMSMTDGNAGLDVPNVREENLDTVDLLLMVDNSGSMRENQANIMAQFGPLIDLLVNPPCLSRSTPGGGMPHPCMAGNADDVPQYPTVTDLHVGVVSSDLGTPGTNLIPGCDAPETGDDGLLNPIRNGAALREHLPWMPRRMTAEMAPAGFRPMACNNDPTQFPNFIKFCSNAADASCDVAGANASTRNPTTFADWFKCNAGLFVNGCGLESQLEAVWRALVQHNARAMPGNTSPNAGFLRENAVLAIIVLSDEEDGSVRLCTNDRGFSAQTGAMCRDARTVYDPASMAWGSPNNLDQRFYRYAPGSAQDPTWDIDRYYNRKPAGAPFRWTQDLLSLKPGHPERVIFAGICGVPVEIPMTPMMGAEPARIDWDRLLGAPRGGPDDFFMRDSSTSISGMQATAGPFSMRANNPDPMCTQVVPACRRVGSTYDPGRPCTPAQYMAYPSRRIVELARRFDQTAACNGQPCHNGLVTSICAPEFSRAARIITTRIQERLVIR